MSKEGSKILNRYATKENKIHIFITNTNNATP